MLKMPSKGGRYSSWQSRPSRTSRRVKNRGVELLPFAQVGVGPLALNHLGVQLFAQALGPGGRELDGRVELFDLGFEVAGGDVAFPAGAGGVVLLAEAEEVRVAALGVLDGQAPTAPGRGVSLQSDQRATEGVQVACVNPAAIGGGTAALDPYFLRAQSAPPPPPITTHWVTYPGLYSATCRSEGGATWLQVATLAPAGRPVVTQSLGPAWGYRLDDINLALGNLVEDVRAAEVTYASHR